jgi:hypothetical protein
MNENHWEQFLGQMLLEKAVKSTENCLFKQKSRAAKTRLK